MALASLFSRFSCLCSSTKVEEEKTEFITNVQVTPIIVRDPKKKTFNFSRTDIKNKFDPESTQELKESVELVSYSAIPHPDANVPDLVLTVEESDVMKVGDQIAIRPKGLVNSRLAHPDSLVYFGADVPDAQKSINDVVLGQYTKEEDVSYAYIAYNRDIQAYQIADLGGGGGTYIKVEDAQEINDNCIFYIGNSHIFMQIFDDGKFYKVTCKIIDGTYATREFSYEYTQRIDFGRDLKCKMHISDYGLSRFHAVMVRKDKKWYLIDGDGQNKSTNGTWIMVDTKKKISDNMVFKIGSTLFRAKISKI